MVQKASEMALTTAPGKCKHFLQIHSICRSLIEAVEHFEMQRQTLGQSCLPQDRLFSLLSLKVWGLEDLFLVTLKRCQATEG